MANRENEVMKRFNKQIRKTDYFCKKFDSLLEKVVSKPKLMPIAQTGARIGNGLTVLGDISDV